MSNFEEIYVNTTDTAGSRHIVGTVNGERILVNTPEDFKLVGPNGNELVEIVRCEDCLNFAKRTDITGDSRSTFSYCKIGHAGYPGFY